MQTLTVGSFLNLENTENVEALKFTARRLAEHTASVVAENLQPAALAGLASNLWEKAEYVAREPERHRLHEIFTENFTTRFRELKPEISLADNLISEVLSAAATIDNDGSTTASVPEITEGGERETAVETVFPVSPPKADATEVEGKRDEFLGFVKTDEPFAAAQVAETKTAAAVTTVPSEVAPETIPSADAHSAVTPKSESDAAKERNAAANSEGEQAAESKVSAEGASGEKTSPAAAATAAAENNASAGNANKTSALQTETKEPFEFGKCTINLNLTLLPSSASDGNRRRAIVSASSHGSPPEIEFLEVADGENLTEIAELVRGKLTGFKNGLPAKYIEQLRQSKTNSAKKTPTVRTPLAVPTKTAANQSKGEKTISEPKSEKASSAETAKPERGVPASSSAFVPTAKTPIAANEIQGSLF